MERVQYKVPYKEYRWVRDMAWNCLLRSGVDRLPVDVIRVADAYKVKVIPNSILPVLKEGQSGLNYTETKQRYIIFRDSEDPRRCRFTIAHELGHIVLNHDYELTNNFQREPGGGKPIEETLADMFAARLLAPSIVLWGLNLRTAEEIERVCGITPTSASYRAERMEALYQKDRFLASHLERQVYDQFRKYIEMI